MHCGKKKSVAISLTQNWKMTAQTVAQVDGAGDKPQSDDSTTPVIKV